MNKMAIKAAAICMSAAMLTSAFVPSLTTVEDIKTNSTIYAATADEPVQLLKNSTFDEGTKKWGTYLAGGGAAGTISAKDGELVLNITNRGKVNYGVQLYYDIIPLYKNAKYKLSFDIRCDTERYVEAMIQQNGGTYQAYVWAGLDLTTEMQHVEKEFVMKGDTDLMTKMCFNCGVEENDEGKDLGEHNIYLDNVYLELIDDSKVDYSEFVVPEETILTNEVGYLEDASKIAVFRGEGLGKTFSVVNADTKEVVYTADLYGEKVNESADETDWLGDFTAVKTPGTYYITSGDNESMPFTIGNDVYNTLLEKSVYMFYLQRCGVEIQDTAAPHSACHTEKAVIYGTNEEIDVSGGWHDAGDYGRYVSPAAKAVADLLIAYEKAPTAFGDSTGIPESGNNIPDILDEVRYELEWMLKMQDQTTGGVHHKVSCEGFPGYVMPDKETDQLIVTPVSTLATADFCAAMAMAYEWYQDFDKDFADKCLKAAESAWAFLEANPNFIFENPKDIVTGEYGDKSDKDERYWAAAQMYRATGDSKYSAAFEAMALKTGMGWADMGDYASFAYLTMDSSLQNEAVKSKIEASILEQADELKELSEDSPYGVTLDGYYWGCNMGVADNGMILYLANMLNPDGGYSEVGAEQLNYLLGKNPNGLSFVTGFGTKSPENPHHRPSMAAGKAVSGMLVGGPNSALEDSAVTAYCEDNPPAKCYIDNAESYSTNEITIYWNSPLVALIADVVTESGVPSIITPQPSTTTEPDVTTTEPDVTTTEPDVTTTEPDVITTEPDVITTEPDVITTEPDVITTEPDSTTEEPHDMTIIYGDFNDDKIVDLTDLTTLSLRLLNDIEFSEKQEKAADVNGNGEVNIADLAYLRLYLTDSDKVQLGPKN